MINRHSGVNFPFPDGLARGLAGTKPYMAPEVFATSLDPDSGYGCDVDWWSLGVTAFEMRSSGVRPFDIHADTLPDAAIDLITSGPNYSLKWSPEFIKYIQSLLRVRPDKRATSLASLKNTK